MAGHSQFKNIMYRKGAQDKKRAKVFSKIIRELTVAAKDGDDLDMNPKLRSAVLNARAANMPKDTMERAIKRGAGGEDNTDYYEIRYEGYGPSGVAMIVDVLTDNKNRSAADVRAAFTKYGGNLGETNSVSFMFDRVGLIQYGSSAGSADEMFEMAVELGAENVESSNDGHTITASIENFNQVREALTAKYGNPESSSLTWQPKVLTPIDSQQTAQTLMKLIDALEDNDDVQTVSANFDIPDDILSKLGD